MTTKTIPNSNQVTLREIADWTGMSLDAVRKRANRDADFPRQTEHGKYPTGAVARWISSNLPARKQPVIPLTWLPLSDQPARFVGVTAIDVGVAFVYDTVELGPLRIIYGQEGARLPRLRTAPLTGTTDCFVKGEVGHECFYVDVFTPDGTRYKADTADLARLLKSDVPYVPENLTSDHLLQWNPGDPPLTVRANHPDVDPGALTDYLGHYPRELHDPLKAVAGAINWRALEAAEYTRSLAERMRTQHLEVVAQAASVQTPPDLPLPWEWDQLSTAPVNPSAPGLEALVSALNRWSPPVEWGRISIEKATPAQKAFMGHFVHDELPNEDIRFAHALIGIRPGQTPLIHCNAPIYAVKHDGIFRYSTPRSLMSQGLTTLDLTVASEPIYQADDGFWYPVPAMASAGYNAGYNGNGPRYLGDTITWMLAGAEVGDSPSPQSGSCDLAENLLVKPGADRRIDRDELLAAAGL